MNDYVQSIKIPSSVKKINENQFLRCNNLNQIIADEENDNFSSVDGILFTKNMSTL